MAFANAAVSDIIATTIQSRTGELADNVTNNNAVLRRLKSKNNVRPFSGGNLIMQEISYTDLATQNVNLYSGFEVLNVGQNSPISAAQFNITQYAGAVTISGLEMIQNSSKQQIIDLLDGRMGITESQLSNRIGSDIYLDGTGNAGKNITGIAACIPANPAVGTYGGIDRGTFTFWRPRVFSGLTDGGAAVSATNILGYMDALAVQLVRGNTRPDLITADSIFYRYFLQAMQAIQRITNDGSDVAKAGFTALKYYGSGGAADVVLDGGIGAASPANTMYFLNTEYLMFRPHSDRNFVAIGGERQAVNQDAVVRLYGWAGNLTCSGAQFQGALVA